MYIGDKVKVKNQDITGIIERIDGYSASIIDDDSEWKYPESLLEYRLSDLEEIICGA